VYATARTPESIDVPGVETLRLDITDPASIAAASAATDVGLLINNAGIATTARSAHVRILARTPHRTRRSGSSATRKLQQHADRNSMPPAKRFAATSGVEHRPSIRPV
jgi:NAD(P)-dependent dehydrogenase (short-subunit alcohol dehydrogenase family)